MRAFIASEEFHVANPEAMQRLAELRLSAPMSVEVGAAEGDLVELTGQIAETWRQLGWTKPHWSALPDERFLPENVDGRRREFFASGADDVAQLLEILRYLGREPEEFATVTEFGCGLGRVTFHLAQRFKRVVACDISASHLE